MTADPRATALDRLLDANGPALELAIHSAMSAGDMPAVVSLMKLLAIRDPRRAQVVLNIVELGLEIDKRERKSAEEAGR